MLELCARNRQTMCRCCLVLLLVLLASFDARANPTVSGTSSRGGPAITGTAEVIDGDTIEVQRKRIRLEGIDAPESSQRCIRSGVSWDCGREATLQLRTLLAKRTVRCTPTGKDRNGRTLAACDVGGRDVGAWMVTRGWALAFIRYSSRYGPQESLAHSAQRGLWAGDFATPWEWRQCKAKRLLRGSCSDSSKQVLRTAPYSASMVREPSKPMLQYKSCKDVRAVGAAPLHRGQPGYSLRLDGDRDGVACE